MANLLTSPKNLLIRLAENKQDKESVRRAAIRSLASSRLDWSVEPVLMQIAEDSSDLVTVREAAIAALAGNIS